jgi:endonuclease/exonuclease/phosphatase family metal-dependent hydrolase
VWREDGINEDALGKLTEKVWPHYVFNRKAVFPGGTQGNAVLSRYHLESSKDVDVSVAGVEPRGFVEVRAELPAFDGEVSLVCLHFGLKEKERVFQAQRLVRYMNEEIPPSMPVVVAGDFNDWTGTVHRQLRAVAGLAEAVENFSGKRGRTFPSLFPLLALDRIYCRGLEVVEARVLREAGWRGLSDHAPVLAAFKLPGRRPA